MSIDLIRDYENFPDPLFAIGEQVADGLILGLLYQPESRSWMYYVESPELDPSSRWLPEADMER